MLQRYITAREGEAGRIPAPRRAALDRLAIDVAERRRRERVALTFICTHNSRRSHLAQVWAQIAARRFHLSTIDTFSGGTEATAFDRRAVAALERAGCHIEIVEPGGNPVYAVRDDTDAPPILCFSKTFTDRPNPDAGFVAVLTCSSADAACPIVPGAAARVVLDYEDPQAFDRTARETEGYDERCAQIAREMLYLFERVASHPGAS